MKTKIYLVTFTSYTESDNYLHNEQKTFTNPLFAQDYYEKMCNNATENANDIYEDEDGNLDERIVEGTESRQDANNRTFKIERETGTEFGYQAEIKLEAVEINAPATWLFDREHFTEAQANAVTIEEALQLSDGTPKSERKVWRYEGNSGTFAADFNRGCITPDKYFIRII